MTPSSINRAVAEAVGMTVVPCTCVLGRMKDARTGLHIPQYTEDLNAVHSAEKVLFTTESRWREYLNSLDAVTKPRDDESWVGAIRRATHATAPQRCESLLRVLNLWEETEEHPKQ